MNRFQVIALWLLGIALTAYLLVKNHTATYALLGLAIIAVLIFITVLHVRQPKEGAITHGHSMAAPPPSATNDLVNNAFPSVEIPAMGKPRAVFKKDSLEYRGKSLYYRDITSVSYNTVSLVIHGIPSSQTYTFQVKSAAGKISISFASAFYINNAMYKERYTRLIELSKAYLEPTVVAGFVKSMFMSGAVLKIGDLSFSKDGYSKKKLFGGVDSVKWNDRVYIPQYAEGNVYVYKDKDGKARTLSVISMTAANSAVLPELVQACYDRANGIKRQAE